MTHSTSCRDPRKVRPCLPRSATGGEITLLKVAQLNQMYQYIRVQSHQVWRINITWWSKTIETFLISI